MDRARKAIPVSNHVTYERHRQKKYKKHRQIVTTTVKCKVDARLSGAAATKRTNVKREQILEERYYEIERNNLHLLKKMHAMYNVSVSAGTCNHDRLKMILFSNITLGLFSSL